MLSLSIDVLADGRFRLETFKGTVTCVRECELADTIRKLASEEMVHVAEPTNPIAELAREHAVERYGETAVAAAEEVGRMVVGFGQKHLANKGGCSRKAASMRRRKTKRR